LVASAHGFLLGCNAIVGIEQPVDRTAAPAPGPAGDSGADSGATGATAFVGAWQSTSEAVDMASCPGGSESTMVMLVFRIDTGTSSDLVLNSMSNGRTFDFNVSGNTATLVVPDSYTTNPTPDETDAVTLTTGSFTLDPGGTTGTLRLGGTATVSSPTAQGTCSISEYAPCTKTSN
jgi:hypothetical protein